MRRVFVPAILIVAVVTIAAIAAAVGMPRTPRPGARAPRTVVASIRAEPRSFNRYVVRDLSSTVVSYLINESLVRIDRTTDRLEPDLATSWDLLDDQRTYRVHLRRDVRFSDGTPFSADDVLFSFRAIYDPRAATFLADSLLVANEPLVVGVEDAHTVTIRFPTPFGPGLRILDGVPVLPRRGLMPALERGTFASAWNVSTPPSEVAGLGPFRLVRYEPGQRVTFERNPYYWAASEGLPKADRVVLEIVPDQESEALRLQAGEIDFTESEMRAADVGALERAGDRGGVNVHDLGVGLDGDLFWINLKPGVADRAWLRATAFRQAISRAVDRDAFVRTVYLGHAVPGYTLVSPGNRGWYADAPAPAYDLAAARQLLASLHLLDRDDDGVVEDDARHAARFTLLTQSGNTSLERGAAFIRDSLERAGVRVDVVPLDAGALVDRVMNGSYDAAYFRLVTTDTDPTLNADFWLSSGSAHVWNPAQRAPSTAWEREIDMLMGRLSVALDPGRRRAIFSDVQAIIARELPALCFAYPRVTYAMNTRIVGATPALFRPPVLWNPAVLEVRP